MKGENCPLVDKCELITTSDGPDVEGVGLTKVAQIDIVHVHKPRVEGKFGASSR